MGLSVWHQWPRFAWLPDAMDGRDLLMHSIKYGNLNSIPTSLVVSDKRLLRRPVQFGSYRPFGPAPAASLSSVAGQDRRDVM